MTTKLSPVGQAIKHITESRQISLSAFASVIFMDRRILSKIVRGQYSVPKYFMQLVTKRLNLSMTEKIELAEAIAKTPDVARSPQTEDVDDSTVDVCIRELLKFEVITKDQATFINQLCDENERLRAKLPKEKRCAI